MTWQSAWSSEGVAKVFEDENSTFSSSSFISHDSLLLHRHRPCDLITKHMVRSVFSGFLMPHSSPENWVAFKITLPL